MDTITRKDAFLKAAADGTPSGLKPATHLEYVLDEKVKGKTVQPNTREEANLLAVAKAAEEGHGGDDYTKPYQRVELIDYDGELVAGYTPDEFLALSAYPEAPEHDGLTFDGWNWTLDEAKAYVRECGLLTVGAVYKPTDGYMHLKVAVAGNKTGVGVTATVTGVDWGDGTSISEETTGIGHTYSEPGIYDITIQVKPGTALTKVTGGNNYANVIEAVLSSSISSISGSVFSGTNLQRIVIPNGTSASTVGGLLSGLLLTGVVMPATGTFGTEYGTAFSGNSVLRRVSFSPACPVGSGSASMFAECRSLLSFSFPRGSSFTPATAQSAGNSGMFAYCAMLKGIAIPDEVTGEFGDGSFNGTTNLDTLIFHQGIRAKAGAISGTGAKYIKLGDPDGLPYHGNFTSANTRLKRVDLYSFNSIAGGTVTQNSTIEEINFDLPDGAVFSGGAIGASYALKRLIVPGNIDRTSGVSSGMLASCPNLEELIFEDGPTNFDNAGTVSGVPGLKKVVFPSTIQSISSNFFVAGSYMPHCTIYCPWSEGAVAGAPWGAVGATVVYDYHK